MGQIVLLESVIEKAVVSDFLKALWEDMEQEALYEFQRGYVDWARLLVIVPACGKNDFLLRNRYDSGIRNRDFEDIAAQVLQSIASAVKGLLDMGDPFCPVKGRFETIPRIGVVQVVQLSRKVKTLLGVGDVQRIEEFSSQHGTHDGFSNKEGAFRQNLQFAIWRQSTTREYSVDVRVIFKLLIPCV